ncbi:hypothetical protein CCOS865_04326 [Pseudomonas reidholzensis]|uniref:Uncharacterized protein n=1 Tax=Pseudomonas reidholzensis TaxID=1785162 RepID=A0A383RZY8_9PSED|nr:hypothetical protein [Pseudomonas reidholzensis]SYX92046.1 hypothetical protein CCOS865_04326 [Pseudomonas reidholzensis]
MSYSLQQLLEWMNGKSRLFGWGAVVALDRQRINRLLAQDFIKRFTTASYLPPINQSVPLDSASQLLFEHFLLDAPRLSFENAELNDAKARLSMDVIAGGHVRLLKKGAHWTVKMIDRVTPLGGPRLRLDLSLPNVPGLVGAGGLIYLDLRNSSNFTLDISPIEEEQQRAGSYFSQLFKRLPNHQRTYPLGNIRAGVDPLLQAKSFKIRTQAKSAAARDARSADYGEGAVLAFICLQGASLGTLPGADSDFRYLLPNDAGKDYSATVLTDRPRVDLSYACQAVNKVIGNAGFRLTSVATDSVVSAVANGGSLRVPGSSSSNFSVPITLPNPGAPVITAAGYYTCRAFDLQAKDQLKVQVHDNELTVTWDIRTSANVTCESLWVSMDGEYVGGNQSGIVANPLNLDIRLKAVSRYRINRAQNVFEFVSMTFEDTRSAATDVAPWTARPDPETTANWWQVPWDDLIKSPGLWLQMMLFIVPTYVVGALMVAVGKGPDMRPLIEAQLKKNFVFSGSINTFVDESIKLNFGQAIQGDEVHIKHDVGFFGQVNPALTHFVLDPLEPRMAAGGTQQFSAVPAAANLRWTVEALQTGVRTASNPGVIDQKGKYTAPAASEVENGMTRVRVTATSTVSNVSSSALVTVLSDTLSIRPLVEILTPGEALQLTAGTLNASDSLTWRIVNAPKHGSLVGSTYTAPTFPEPVQGQPKPPAYVVDVVEVRNTQSGAVRTAAIVTDNNVSISINISDLNLQQGRVELQASINGEITHDAEWTVLLDGPGSISADGVYVADPAREERFVLIESKEDGGKYGLWTGLILLPLPLLDYTQTYDVLHPVTGFDA